MGQMISKEKEISLISSLIEANGYFSDELGQYKETMIQNIKNDYPLLMGTGIISEKEYKTEQAKRAKIEAELDRTKGVVEGLIETMLRSSQRFGDEDLLHKAIAVIGHKEVIKLKLRMELPLWDIDNKFILENL